MRYEEELVKEYEQEEIRRVLKLISTDGLIKEIKHRVEWIWLLKSVMMITGLYVHIVDVNMEIAGNGLLKMMKLQLALNVGRCLQLGLNIM